MSRVAVCDETKRGGACEKGRCAQTGVGRKAHSRARALRLHWSRHPPPLAVRAPSGGTRERVRRKEGSGREMEGRKEDGRGTKAVLLPPPPPLQPSLPISSFPHPQSGRRIPTPAPDLAPAPPNTHVLALGGLGTRGLVDAAVAGRGRGRSKLAAVHLGRVRVGAGADLNATHAWETVKERYAETCSRRKAKAAVEPRSCFVLPRTGSGISVQRVSRGCARQGP